MDAQGRMDSRNLEHAAEFCRLVGAPDLVTYLGLADDVDSAEARHKLKARRKYMQGMQGNPKYKQEALFLIKHFSSLDSVLTDLGAYLADARRRAESVHLPILEMTIKGVLAGGSLTEDQEAYLRRNAVELGVSEETFDELLDRLAKEAGIPRSGPPRRPTEREADKAPTPPPAPAATGELYRVLDVTPNASGGEVEEAWRRKRAQLEKLPPSSHREELKVRVDLARNVLKDVAARQQYDLSSSRTGPPARTRVARPDQAATAPPVRPRSSSPSSENLGGPSTPSGGRPARLEVDGDPQRSVRVFSSPHSETIVVRNIGDQPLAGTVTTDVGWIRVEPSQLDPGRKEQDISVVIEPDLMETGQESGSVRIATDAGEAAVQFLVRRIDPRVTVALSGAAVFVALLVVAAVGFMVFRTAGPGSSGLTIRVDPAAAEVRLDGREIGSGAFVVVPEPPLGAVTLAVSHPNFAPYTKELTIERGRAQEVEVTLELVQPMDFRPTPNMAKGAVDAEAARQLVGSRGGAIDACLRRGARVGQILTGTVRVHIAKDGRAAGFEVQGKNVDDEAVQACLARQTAAITFPPLTRGDYATVRYDYTVTADPDAP